MKSIKSTILYIFPKALIFALALANLAFIRSHQLNQGGTKLSFCVVCPWYETDGFSSIPSVLFLAAFLLLLSQRWSHIIATVLSGGLLFYGLFFLIRAISNFGVIGYLNFIQISESSILLIIEMQWILAAIICGFTIFYLLKRISRTAAFQP